jgi:hypothetical protein
MTSTVLTALCAALAGAVATPALIVDAQSPVQAPINAADSGERLAAVMQRSSRPRYQLRLNEARDLLGT